MYTSTNTDSIEKYYPHYDQEAINVSSTKPEKYLAVTYSQDYQIDYDEYLIFNPRLFSKSRKDKASLRRLAEVVFSELSYKSKYNLDDKLEAVENVLCNLFRGARKHQVVSISLNANEFPPIKGISYESLYLYNLQRDY